MNQIINTAAVAAEFNAWFKADPRFREASPTHAAWTACWGVVQAFQDGSLAEISGTTYNILVHALNEHNCPWSSAHLCEAIAQTMEHTVMLVPDPNDLDNL